MNDKSVKPKFKIINGRDGSDSLIRKVCEIDQVIFDENYRTIYENEVLLYRKNKDIYTFLFDGEKLIGYCCFLPLDKKTYKEIKQGKLVDDTKLTPDQILTFKPGKSYNLYFSQIAILPEYKGKGARSFLMKGINKALFDTLKRGIYINNVMVDAVTAEGVKMAKDYNFKKICVTSKGTTIYSGNAISIISSFILKSSLRNIKNSIKSLFTKGASKAPYDGDSTTIISSSSYLSSNNSSAESPHHDYPKIHKVTSFTFVKNNSELSDISEDKTVDSISTNKKNKFDRDKDLFKYEGNLVSKDSKNIKNNKSTQLAPGLERANNM